jgi:RNA polymerase sigma factor (sigma-70 family)
MTEEDALEMVLANLEKEAVRKAIQALEPQQQELVMDIYFRGRSMADVARRDGVHKSSVTKRMNRIIEQLSKKLKKF